MQWQGSFKNFTDQAGVHCSVVPAEAHHKIGLIERHNAVLRDCLERIVDNQSAATAEDMEIALSAALHGKNSLVHHLGRPPCMAAFGRLPRLPEELLSDPNGLVTGESASDMHRKAELYRCEATKAIAEMQASSAIRKALLRKTALQGSALPDVHPGSRVAYWRWQHRRKGIKKRGGYSIVHDTSDHIQMDAHAGYTQARPLHE